FGLIAGPRDASGAPGFHQRLAVGLLLEADAHHVDAHLETEEGAGKSQRRTPLPGAGLRREPPDTSLLVVEGLRHGGVRLMAASGADALVFVINPGGGIQRPLQPA